MNSGTEHLHVFNAHIHITLFAAHHHVIITWLHSTLMS